jgi:hypothetical protein
LSASKKTKQTNNSTADAQQDANSKETTEITSTIFHILLAFAAQDEQRNQEKADNLHK